MLSDYLYTKKEELENWREKNFTELWSAQEPLSTLNGKILPVFLNLEKKILNNSIPELIDQDGKIHTNLDEIMEMQYFFYTDLFTAYPLLQSLTQNTPNWLKFYQDWENNKKTN